MRTRLTSRSFALVASLSLIALTSAACELAVASFKAEARDEWTRSYPLGAGGSVEIGNTNGTIEVTQTSGATVEVRAERVAKAASDEAAKDLLRQLEIREDISASRVKLETKTPQGIRWGGVEVRYFVTVPSGTAVKVDNTNGKIRLTDLTGAVTAETTNGGVSGTGLAGAVRASTTNGGVDIDVSAVHADGIVLETTNGGVSLSLPADARADVSASCTNGGISVDLPIEKDGESSRRSLRGRLNGGGPRVSLETVNGGVRIGSHGTK
jgi:DUF4097 and DUF4098 domain-containing protein YvlB